MNLNKDKKKFNLKLGTHSQLNASTPGDLTMRTTQETMYNKPNYNGYLQNKMVLKTHEKPYTLLEIKEAVLKQQADRTIQAAATHLSKNVRSLSAKNLKNSRAKEELNDMTVRNTSLQPRRLANTVNWLTTNELENNRIFRGIQESVTVGDGGLHELIHDKLNPFIAGRSKCATFVKDLFEI